MHNFLPPFVKSLGVGLACLRVWGELWGAFFDSSAACPWQDGDLFTEHIFAVKSLSLIGLPGSGKSTVGRHLARRLGMAFVDTDHVIETRIGCTIAVFFEREGEAAFRDLESKLLDELTSDGQAKVLSTGGGIVLRPENRVFLRDRSEVMYLHTTPEDLIRRLRNDTTRPLLQVANPLQRLRELAKQRDGLYREAAHFVLETGRPSVATLVNMIMMQLELAGWDTPFLPDLDVVDGRGPERTSPPRKDTAAS